MLKVFAATLMAVCAASCAQTTASISSTAAIAPAASAAEPQLMAASGPAFAPPAFYAFCAQRADLCASTGPVRKMTMTKARQSELQEVNLLVNRQIREVSDLEMHGEEDVWGVPRSAGDCEDFAILKKKELMKRGWPASTLLLTVVTVGGEGHVVLTASTDRGDIILDNRTNSLRDWTKVRYNFFARQSQHAHGKWERIVAAGA
ncbi:transglutaminase-like cysteine peptidase [Aliihoeflea sp. 40Bstr573]|uniref:transglutaminase-like cysteine peptidase n=1 Tax=Aliihoeflea sp. 40Bstr573 TaxID=2696467 RepID=UPI0020962AD1|nr:transglutaminase-like cysteine peptidase [Aliihoeflea sp. 40Bstr573]